jgi:hypothetical protein
MPDALESHYRTVVRALAEGRVIPLLGAGVNLCGRPLDSDWRRGQYLPSGAELAEYLASYFEYPTTDLQDLIRVSQYASVMTGLGPLYEELHQVLDADYPPTVLHQFLAALPGILRAQGTPRYQLIMTTNYDDALERAFRALDEPYDVVWYVAEGEHRGKFYHLPPDGKGRIIDKPNKYLGFALDQRTVIAKIHGAVDRLQPERDSYVITEDHYIDYLSKSPIESLVPVQVLDKLQDSHCLFLGYTVHDWNLRVFLKRIWEGRLGARSWAIEPDPDTFDKDLWAQSNVDLYASSLADYIDQLQKRLVSRARERRARER